MDTTSKFRYPSGILAWIGHFRSFPDFMVGIFFRSSVKSVSEFRYQERPYSIEGSAYTPAESKRGKTGLCSRMPPATLRDGMGSADVALHFQALPRVPVIVMFWDAEPEDGFEAEASLIFDETITDHLDIESILFLSERLQQLQQLLCGMAIEDSVK